MKDKDAKLLEEAYIKVNEAKGKYVIKVSIVSVPEGEVIESMQHEISGDEAVWDTYQSVHKLLAAKEYKEPSLYPEEELQP